MAIVPSNSPPAEEAAEGAGAEELLDGWPDLLQETARTATHEMAANKTVLKASVCLNT
jgi:hypothetical protein